MPGIFLPIVQQTLGRDFVVILVNKDGIVLDIKGNPLVLGRMGESLCCGALLREAEVGNLAVTTALRAGAAVEVEGVEHFCQAYHDLVSSAAPILAPDGSVYGAIGVFNRIEHKNPYVLGMIRTAAQAITNGVYMNMVDEELRLQHKYLEAIVESISDGFVAIDGSGRLTYMNASAGRVMGLDPKVCVCGGVEGIDVGVVPAVVAIVMRGVKKKQTQKRKEEKSSPKQKTSPNFRRKPPPPPNPARAGARAPGPLPGPRAKREGPPTPGRRPPPGKGGKRVIQRAGKQARRKRKCCGGGLYIAPGAVVKGDSPGEGDFYFREGHEQKWVKGVEIFNNLEN